MILSPRYEPRVILATNGTSTTPDDLNPYGYNPTLWICAMYLALYSLSTILHLGQALWTRTWFMIPSVVLGGIGEILGWTGRLWSSINVDNDTPYLIQISSTILAPTFLAAANFIILGAIIRNVGEEYSRLRSSMYAKIFVTIDIAALVVQAVGGGIASNAVTDPNANPNTGGYVMLAGIAIQLVEIFVYVALATEFYLNVSKGKSVRPHVAKERNLAGSGSDRSWSPLARESIELGEGSKPSSERRTAPGLTRNSRIMSYGLALSTLFLFIRAIYRTVELGDGWNGVVIATQVYFNIFDAAMIVLAMFTINLIHPGFLLQRT